MKQSKNAKYAYSSTQRYYIYGEIFIIKAHKVSIC